MGLFDKILKGAVDAIDNAAAKKRQWSDRT